MGNVTNTVSELQANVLTSRMVRKTLPSCIVYSFVMSMAFMVDTIIAGHFLGTDAVAGIQLGIPMIGLMVSFTSMILQGGYLKFLNAMGRNDMKEKLDKAKAGLANMSVSDDFREVALFGCGAVYEYYMSNALKALDKNNGSPSEYLKKELGIRKSECNELQKKFLE